MKLLLGFRLLIVLIPTCIAALIAGTSIYDAHPDERMHVDAFRYFETHWRRPPLGDPQLMYSPMGWSRVYTGETVYPVFGKVSRVLRALHVMRDGDFRLYRYLNVGLLAITLSLLLSVRSQWLNLSLLAVFLVCIPQVIYIYSYANSDAWGVSATMLLLAQAAMLYDREPRQWSGRRLSLFFATMSCVVLSKVGFRLGLILPVILIVLGSLQNRHELTWRWWAQRLIVPALAVAVLSAAFDPNLSPRRRAWQADVLAMREKIAWPGFKPSNPTHGSEYLASRGYTLRDIMQSRWFGPLMKSFYGQFGGLQVQHPRWVFILAALFGSAALVITSITAVRRWRQLPMPLRVCMVLSPLVIAVNFAGILWHALHIDQQFQGRYLFPSLPCVYVLMLGVTGYERARLRNVHIGLIVLALLLSIYTLIACGLVDPTLRTTVFWKGLT